MRVYVRHMRDEVYARILHGEFRLKLAELGVLVVLLRLRCNSYDIAAMSGLQWR